MKQKQNSKKQAPSHTLSIAAMIVAVVAIIAVVIVFTYVRQSGGALAGAARYQAIERSNVPVSQESSGFQQNVADIVNQMPLEQSIENFPIQRVIECPEYLRPSKSIFENKDEIPEDMDLARIPVDYTADGKARSWQYDTKFSSKTCGMSGMACSYIPFMKDADYWNSGTVLQRRNARNCVDAGPRSCKCLTK